MIIKSWEENLHTTVLIKNKVIKWKLFQVDSFTPYQVFYVNKFLFFLISQKTIPNF